jgi:hypothetical protein
MKELHKDVENEKRGSGRGPWQGLDGQGGSHVLAVGARQPS